MTSSKKSNAWAHALANAGGSLEDVGPSSSGKERKQLLGGDNETLKNTFKVEKDASKYLSWNSNEEKTDHSSSSSSSPYGNSGKHRTPVDPPTSMAAARVGDSDCFSTLQNVFALHQNLAALRSSHSKEENDEHSSNQPPKCQDCAGKFSEIINNIYNSYTKAIGTYKDPYYGKNIDHSKLRQLATASVRTETEDVNPEPIPVQDSEGEEESFLSVYEEFPRAAVNDESKNDDVI